MKFQKKPVVIEAVQWTGQNMHEINAFCGAHIQSVLAVGMPFTVGTLEGPHKASVCDWIIRGVKGEFYPCKPDIFEMTYEVLEMTKEREVLQQALEALEALDGCLFHSTKALMDKSIPVIAEPAIAAIRKVLEQPKQEPPANKYNEKRIAWELERTAMGDGYYGNSLYVALDMPQATKADKDMLHRYLHGSNLVIDHVRLQDLALRIYNAALPVPEAELIYVEPAIEAKLKEKNT